MLKELELREKMRARAMELGSILTPEAVEAMDGQGISGA